MDKSCIPNIPFIRILDFEFLQGKAYTWKTTGRFILVFNCLIADDLVDMGSILQGVVGLFKCVWYLISTFMSFKQTPCLLEKQQIAPNCHLTNTCES